MDLTGSADGMNIAIEDMVSLGYIDAVPADATDFGILKTLV